MKICANSRYRKSYEDITKRHALKRLQRHSKEIWLITSNSKFRRDASKGLRLLRGWSLGLRNLLTLYLTVGLAEST